MDTTLAQKAISLALNGEWEEGIKVNKEILAEAPDDVDSLNRMARCYSEIGKLKEAKQTAKKVLELDPLNSIAQKCLERWTATKKGSKHTKSSTSADSFLEESGKTKIAPLMHIGDVSLLASIDSGDEVFFLPHTHRVSVITSDGKFLGRLHDDLAARIRFLLKSGFKYQVLVKAVEPKKGITIFIREVERGDGTKNMTSFPPERIEYVTFTSPDLVHKDVPEIETTEDE